MKFRSFIILLAICCGLAAVTYVVLVPTKETSRQSMLGQKPFESLAVNDIAAITITAPGSEIVLKKQASGWTVANRFNYPANFSNIADFAKKINRLTIGRNFKATPETISRLALHPPERKDIQKSRKGVRVLLADKNNNSLLDLIIGKSRESSAGTGGQYVMPSKTSMVYLVDGDFRYLEKEASEWLDSALFDIKAEDIEKVIAHTPGRKTPLYTLKRPSKDKAPVFVSPPENKTVTSSKIDEVFEALWSMEINDISDPLKTSRQTGFEILPHFEYHLFDGTVYRIYPGNAVNQDEKQFYLKVDVSYQKPKPEPADDQSSSPEEEAARQKKETELQAEIKRLSGRISPWTYIVSKWKIERFVNDPEEFFEK